MTIQEFSISPVVENLLKSKGVTVLVDRACSGYVTNYKITFFDRNYKPFQLISGRPPSVNHEFDRTVNLIRHSS